MHDIRWIRQFPELFDQGLTRRGKSPLSKIILEKDRIRRKLINEQQTLQTRRNQIAKDFQIYKSEGKSLESLKSESDLIKKRLPQVEEDLGIADADLQELLLETPNTPHASSPDGMSEDDSVEVRRHGTPRSFSFTPKSHETIGHNLGLMDFERSAKLSGSRFVVLYRELAQLERALAQFMLDTHVTEFGYTEVYPPLLVRDQTMLGIGQLPKFKDDMFQTTTGLYLISTSEVVLTNLVAEEILDGSQLPLRYTAYTPCFRSEAGAAGRDTRGMIRQHQFGKVELVSITTAENSEAEHERMTHCAETILQRLCLPYRVMALCAGDMGFCSEKTYDLEVWIPSQNTYREISSCSRCSDFQGRRMNARYRDSEGQLHFVHTLNGSGLAVGRTLVALLENYQQEDGSIPIPEALLPYMRGVSVIQLVS